MRNIRKRRWVLLALLIVVGVGFYFGCVRRYRLYAEQAGWVGDLSILPFRCSFCTGRLDRFTYADRPVPLPRLDEQTFAFSLNTPVGYFETRAGWHEYRAHWVSKVEFPEAGAPVTGEELVRGHYELQEYSSFPPPRRPGTPDHWCFAVGGSFTRWLDPELIDDLSWSTPASAPTTQPD